MVLLKISAILVVLILVVVSVGGPTVFAQNTTQWKTYREPSQFSLDYPVFDKDPNITKEQNKSLQYEITTIDSHVIAIMITKSHNPLIDPQESAVISKETSLEMNPNTVVLKDIFTSIYDGNIGYTFVIENLDDGAVTVDTYLQRGYDLYHFYLLGFWDNPYLLDTFDRILESINF